MIWESPKSGATATFRIAAEQLKGLIRAGYVYRNGDEHLLTEKGRAALAQLGVHPGVANDPDDVASKSSSISSTRPV